MSAYRSLTVAEALRDGDRTAVDRTPRPAKQPATERRRGAGARRESPQ